MLANGINISSFGGMLLSLDISNAQIVTLEEWLKGAYDPIHLSEDFYYKKIEVEILVQGKDRNDAVLKMSNLINLLRKATLKFDDLDFYYDAKMVSNTATKTIEIEKIVLKAELKSGYAYKPIINEIINKITTKTITVPGNLKTPCVVEIIPTIDIIDVTLEGLADDPIIIRNLKGGKKVILDGELQKVTVDGINKFGDTDLWDFPRLIPGSNTLKFSRNNCDIKIKYKPRWI